MKWAWNNGFVPMLRNQEGEGGGGGGGTEEKPKGLVAGLEEFIDKNPGTRPRTRGDRSLRAQVETRESCPSPHSIRMGTEGRRRSQLMTLLLRRPGKRMTMMKRMTISIPGFRRSGNLPRLTRRIPSRNLLNSTSRISMLARRRSSRRSRRLDIPGRPTARPARNSRNTRRGRLARRPTRPGSGISRRSTRS